MTARLLRFASTIAAGVLLAVASLIGQSDRLSIGQPLLFTCNDRPCFRLNAVAKNASGELMGLPADQFTVSIGGRPLPNVAALEGVVAAGDTTRGPAAQQDPPRVWFVVFDTSGSMKDRLAGRITKFDAARTQLRGLLDNFRDGIDRMAIAPFDSRDVSRRVMDARFLDRKAAIEQVIDTLPAPQADTALYYALYESIRRLWSEVSPGSEVSIVVFTDGKNDTGRATDVPAEATLDYVADYVRRFGRRGGTVYTVGLGSPGVSFDANALRALAFPDESNYLPAENEEGLRKAFKGISRERAAAARLLVGPLPYGRDELPGSVVLQIANGRLTGEVTWQHPELVSRAPDQYTLSSAEAKAIAGWQTADPTALAPELTRMAVLAGYSALLALLWFGVPRLVWPDRYVQKPALAAGTAKTAPKATPRGPLSRPSPAPGARPEVTLPPVRPKASRSPQTPAQPARGGDRVRDPEPAAAPEALGERAASDATVFIPPKKPKA